MSDPARQVNYLDTRTETFLSRVSQKDQAITLDLLEEGDVLQAQGEHHFYEISSKVK
ncbi:uncharacterized protein PHALS_03435 [Plasmopara halstedii]|uniref:Uncharacterized protein n=1 Tax=Plasmopara halstedii TaxID=4781 RepID=A0A0P1AY28_PLAHL|nr:uncharacterized protein PHALS_03435 [Plasmopara halstedii]CEG46752.1 hypothetical protein PHALS_03435 [Plasmopara halstedii]|eukprot:XP_024583121.1 hypothetical protein PHALS_03435 [Plasmopara halstedii]